MQRESHLFACHKFLEETGGQILIRLAKVDFRDPQEIEIFCTQLQDYVTTLVNHARWEEDLIFSKFFTKDEILALFGEHSKLECSGGKIIEALKELLNLPPQSRLYEGNAILNFRASKMILF